MTHPFEKMLEKALGKSTQTDNQLLREAKRILDKGYREEEIIDILRSMEKGRIDDSETELVSNTIEELMGEEYDLADV